MKMRRFGMILLAILSLGFLVGDDCEVDLDGWGHHYEDCCYDEFYYYEPVPVYPAPVYWY